jgi:hypothetical protein
MDRSVRRVFAVARKIPELRARDHTVPRTIADALGYRGEPTASR